MFCYMFTLINLPYAIDALEPVISARTLEFHHGKHLQGYVDNLNKLIVGTEFEALCHSERSEESILAEIVAKAPAGPIFNNAGQILNHNLYFTQFRSFVADAPQDDTRCHSERCCHSERSEESGICHSERSEESILAEIVAKAPAGPIFNNAGQILNHNLYFTQFCPCHS